MNNTTAQNIEQYIIVPVQFICQVAKWLETRPFRRMMWFERTDRFLLPHLCSMT